MPTMTQRAQPWHQTEPPLRCAPAQRIAGAHAVLCAVRPFLRCKATQQSALPHLSHARSTSAACCATCGIPCVCHMRRRCTGCRVVAALHVARRLASSSCRASRRSFRRSQSPAHARPRRPSRAEVRGSAWRSQLSPAGENREGSVQSTVGVAVRCAMSHATCSVVRKRLQSDSSSWTTGMLVPRGT